MRGLGNIVTEKSVDDFITYESELVYEDNVYTLEYYLTSGVVVTVSAKYVKSGDTLTITATVTDENKDPISGASVELFKEVN